MAKRSKAKASAFLKNEEDVENVLKRDIAKTPAADLSNDGLRILSENRQEEKQAKEAERKDADIFAATEKLEMPDAAPAKKKTGPAPR